WVKAMNQSVSEEEEARSGSAETTPCTAASPRTTASISAIAPAGQVWLRSVWSWASRAETYTSANELVWAIDFPLLSQAVNAWSKALLAVPRAALSAVNWAPAEEAPAGPALMTSVEVAAAATDNAAAAATKTFFMGSSRRVVGDVIRGAALTFRCL